MNSDSQTRDLRTLEASKRVNDGRWQNPVYQARLRLLARLGAWFITLINSMVRIDRIGFDKYLQAAAGSRPTVIVAWHGSLVSSIYCHRRRNIVIMTSLSQDGDLLTQILYYLGFKCVRGSSSRGGMRGLLEMIKLLRSGMQGAITVDGPRGPLHEVKPGAVLAAQKADALLVPIGLAFSRCYRFNNWDKTAVPLPGSRVVMVSGEPFAIPGELAVEDGCRLIKEKIEESEQKAQQILKNER